MISLRHVAVAAVDKWNCNNCSWQNDLQTFKMIVFNGTTELRKSESNAC